MTDTDIAALVERLRIGARTLAQYHLEEDVLNAADALEALQGDIEDLRALVSEWRDIRAPALVARAEKTEADLRGNREALVVCRSLLRENRDRTLEEAARVAEGKMAFDDELRKIRDHIAAAIRALAGDKP